MDQEEMPLSSWMLIDAYMEVFPDSRDRLSRLANDGGENNQREEKDHNREDLSYQADIHKALPCHGRMRNPQRAHFYTGSHIYGLEWVV